MLTENKYTTVPTGFLWELLEHLDADENSAGSRSFANDIRSLLGVFIPPEDRLDEDSIPYVP